MYKTNLLNVLYPHTNRLIHRLWKTLLIIDLLKDSHFGAPGGIRTPNDGSEDRRDIHFTTGAVLSLYINTIFYQNSFNSKG